MSGIFNMSGGTIRNCTEDGDLVYSGGGIKNCSTGTVVLSGTMSILNCSGTSEGGAILNRGKMTIRDAVTIDGCSAGKTYSVVYSKSDEFEIAGGEFHATVHIKGGGFDAVARPKISGGTFYDKFENDDKGDTGAQGEKGDKGADGKDGTDGVTPILKIGTDNVWYVSYDNGATWNSLGVKATGEKGDKGDDGTPGAAGKDGKDGVGIAKAEINTNGELVLTYTDGNTVNVGRVVGADGKDGKDGQNASTVKDNADVSPVIIVIRAVAGVSFLGNLVLLLYLVLRKKNHSI